MQHLIDQYTICSITLDFASILNQLIMKKAIEPMKAIQGIHHITAFAKNPQSNANFYHTVLGQRLVKTTVNFDDQFLFRACKISNVIVNRMLSAEFYAKLFMVEV